MTLPVSFNPQSDYQYTVYEPYKYSYTVLSKIYQAVTRINKIKSASNLEQSAVNYLEAIVLSGLLACSSNSIIVSLIPNLLGETLRLEFSTAKEFVSNVLVRESSTEEMLAHYHQYKLLNLYALKNQEISVLEGLTKSPLTLISEFNYSTLAEIQKLAQVFQIAKQNLTSFLVYDDRQIRFEDLEKLLLTSGASTAVAQIRTFNLLEAFDLLTHSTSNVNYLLIPTSFAESNYNPLIVLHEAYQQRKINILETLEVITDQTKVILEENDSSIIEVGDSPAVNLSAQVLAAVVSKSPSIKIRIRSSKLDRYLLELNQLNFISNLSVQVMASDLTNISTNLLLEYSRSQKSKLLLDYLSPQNSKQNTEGIVINFVDSPSSLVDFQNKFDHLFCQGENFTILSWGNAASEVLGFLESSDSLEPEILILKQIWPLPLEAISDSVKRTSRLLIVPDPKLAFPLVDILCNQLSRKLYQLLDAPIKVVNYQDLACLATNLDLMFYED